MEITIAIREKKKNSIIIRNHGREDDGDYGRCIAVHNGNLNFWVDSDFPSNKGFLYK